ncbi:MAG: RNA polymerase factor sigma-54 [Planctomycetota bacterium]
MSGPELGYALRAEQRMLLLPRMLQALDVLQVPRMAMPELVSTAVTENEALRFVKKRRARTAEGGDGNAIDNIPAPSGNLKQHLLEQLAVLETGSRTRTLVETVIESLDGRGFRTLTNAELAKFVSPEASAGEMDSCDRALRSMEPSGAGARDLTEALLWQVPETDPDRAAIEYILKNALPMLARNGHENVARTLDISVEELHGILSKIKKLKTRPSAGFESEPIIKIRPDVFLRKTPSGPEFEFRDGVNAKVGISDAIIQKSKDTNLTPEARAYFRERIEAAKTFLACLEQRRATLEKVVKALFLRQPAFVEHGPKWIRSLQMQDLADALSLHPSTISRAVAGKYIETPWGIFRLRDFFVAGVELSTGGTATRGDLVETIRNIFANENAAAPLEDGAVAAQLQQNGFQVARRTVAKYRADLGIPSSWQRKRENINKPEVPVGAEM